MRNALIFPPSFEMIFFSKLMEEGLIKDTEGIKYGWSPRLYRSYGFSMQKIYQMLLLFDKIKFLASDADIDYSSICALGDFTFQTMDEYEEDIKRLNLQDCEREFAEYLKPALLPTLSDSIRPYYVLKSKNFSDRKFTSYLYDSVFGLEIIERDKSDFDILLEKNLSLISGCSATSSPDIKTTPYDVKEALFEAIIGEFENLSLHLDICSEQNASMLNSIYRLDKIGCRELDFKTHLNAYAILKVECKETIGEMPRMSNISEVLSFRDKHKNDVLRLRQQLDELEYVLRSQPREKAIEKATSNVRRAAGLLSKTHTFNNKVGTWSIYISVPIAIAELLLAIPSIASFSILFIGLTSDINNRIVEKRNNWVEIIR